MNEGTEENECQRHELVEWTGSGGLCSEGNGKCMMPLDELGAFWTASRWHFVANRARCIYTPLDVGVTSKSHLQFQTFHRSKKSMFGVTLSGKLSVNQLLVARARFTLYTLSEAMHGFPASALRSYQATTHGCRKADVCIASMVRSGRPTTAAKKEWLEALLRRSAKLGLRLITSHTLSEISWDFDDQSVTQEVHSQPLTTSPSARRFYHRCVNHSTNSGSVHINKPTRVTGYLNQRQHLHYQAVISKQWMRVNKIYLSLVYVNLNLIETSITAPRNMTINLHFFSIYIFSLLYLPYVNSCLAVI